MILRLLVFLLMLAPVTVNAAAYRVVFAGDSITAANIYGTVTDVVFGGHPIGYVAKLQTDLPALFPGNTFTTWNEGVNGYKTSNWVSMVSSNINSHSPNVVCIMLGTNDTAGPTEPSGAGISLTSYEANLRSIISQIQTYNSATKILLMTPPPVYDTDQAVHPTYSRTNSASTSASRGDSSGTTAGVSAYAQKVRDIVTSIGGNVLLVETYNPTYAHVADANYAGWWYPTDGIHPMQSGHNVLYSAVASVLGSVINPAAVPASVKATMRASFR